MRIGRTIAGAILITLGFSQVIPLIEVAIHWNQLTINCPAHINCPDFTNPSLILTLVIIAGLIGSGTLLLRSGLRHNPPKVRLS